MDSIAPRGFEYWERLADIINQEPVEERDRFFHAMLKPLGIEKGKPFKPDERQKKILTDAAEFGFLMAQTISMAPRFEQRSELSRHALGVGGHDEPQSGRRELLPARRAHRLHLRGDHRSLKAWCKPLVGAGSQYMSAAKDKSGAWLDGGKNYRLRVPANVPVKEFWSVTVYDNMTRSMVQTRHEQGGALLLRQAHGQSRRLHRSVLWTAGATGLETQLDQDIARKGLVYVLPLVRPDSGLLRQDRGRCQTSSRPAERGADRRRRRPRALQLSTVLSKDAQMKKLLLGSLAIAAAGAALAASAAQPPSLSQLQQRAVQRRAVEAVNWGMPAVNYDLMLQEMLNKTAGKVNQSRLLVAAPRLAQPDAHAEPRRDLLHGVLQHEGRRPDRRRGAAGGRRRLAQRQHRRRLAGCRSRMPGQPASTRARAANS